MRNSAVAGLFDSDDRNDLAAMEDAGVSIARNPSEIADALLKIYKG